MKCVNPFVGKNGAARAAFGCGQCMPCRFNRQRLWYHRILLEAMTHERNSFLTLTYREDEVPEEVSPECLSGFVKRLRKHLYGGELGRLRFYGVGEYGDKSFRPHYHLVCFGETCEAFGLRRDCQCMMCIAVRKSWDFGWFSLSSLTVERAKYIAKYTLKRMTSSTDVRLCGRRPEFARMSLRPAVGLTAMKTVASVIRDRRLSLPVSLNHGRQSLPLGRYLRKKLAEYAETVVPPYLDQELPLVQAFAFENSRSIRSVYQELFAAYEASLQNKVRVAYEKSQI